MADDVDIDKLDITDELIAEGRADPGVVPDDMAPWMAAIIKTIDVSMLWVGRLTCLLIIPMIAVVIIEVVGRKLFVAPTDYAYDISRWTMGALFMLGAGYALMKGVHIRADFLYRTLSVKNQARIDLFLYIVFFFPSLALFTYVSFNYFGKAWLTEERSMDTAWMQVVWPVYSTLPIGGALLIIQGISEALKCVYAMQKGEWP